MPMLQPSAIPCFPTILPERLILQVTADLGCGLSFVLASARRVHAWHGDGAEDSAKVGLHIAVASTASSRRPLGSTCG
jgi:hypothetical protein